MFPAAALAALRETLRPWLASPSHVVAYATLAVVGSLGAAGAWRGLWFGDGPLDVTTLHGMALRVALLIVAVSSLDVFGALVRPKDARVIAIARVPPSDVLVRCWVLLAATRWWLVPLLLALTGPALWSQGGSPGARILVVWLAAQVGSWTVGAAVLLAAVRAAVDPRLRRRMDHLRGGNTQEQAALIYAPGIVMVIMGLACAAALTPVNGAHGTAWWSVGIVGACGAAGWGFARATIRQTWPWVGAVVAEVDARHALAAPAEDGRHVYLEGAVRWLPRRFASFVLFDLRHGWRAHRLWVWLPWVLGGGLLWAVWTERARALGPVLLWTGGAIGACFAVAGRLVQDEPFVLARLWHRRARARAWSRQVVAALWMWPLVVCALVGGWMIGGVFELLLIAVWLVGYTALQASVGAFWLAPQRTSHARVGYGLSAVAMWVATLGVGLGGLG